MKRSLMVFVLSWFSLSHPFAGQPMPLDDDFKWASEILAKQDMPDIELVDDAGTLSGDFNGDGKKDVASLFVNAQTEKRGIVIIHGGSNKVILLGGGKKIEGLSDNLDWIYRWDVYQGHIVKESLGQDIRLEKRGFIYWNGQEYRWYEFDTSEGGY